MFLTKLTSEYINSKDNISNTESRVPDFKFDISSCLSQTTNIKGTSWKAKHGEVTQNLRTQHQDLVIYVVVQWNTQTKWMIPPVYDSVILAEATSFVISSKVVEYLRFLECIQHARTNTFMLERELII